LKKPCINPAVSREFLRRTPVVVARGRKIAGEEDGYRRRRGSRSATMACDKEDEQIFERKTLVLLFL
jgi:hypothetical protein